MKKLKLFGTCILFLLIASLANALEDGFPFYGRVIDETDYGIEGITLNLIFDECTSRDIISDENGEFELTTNYPEDIVFNDFNLSCVGSIKPGDTFNVVIDLSAVNCASSEFGNITVGSSLNSLGTYRMEGCNIRPDPTFNPKPSGGGGGAGAAITPEEEMIVISYDELTEKIIANTKQVEEVKEETTVDKIKATLVYPFKIKTSMIIWMIILLIIADILFISYRSIKAKN